jgi:general secretion pathway protein H
MGATSTPVHADVRRPRAEVRRSRGMTLIEVVLAVAIVAFVTGAAMFGMGVVSSARLKQSTVMIAGAIRIAYAHANATSKPVRLVFDFEQRLITLEEATTPMLVMRNDEAGGAAAATEAERKAVEEADLIMKGPSNARPTFRVAKALGFNNDHGKKGKELAQGVRFLQIETAHQDAPQLTGRAYLYFWPGGQTERAAIQLVLATSDESGAAMTLLVSPLTGKSEVRNGKLLMPRPRDDIEESERQDTGY